jgi:hypothetical protein
MAAERADMRALLSVGVAKEAGVGTRSAVEVHQGAREGAPQMASGRVQKEGQDTGREVRVGDVIEHTFCVGEPTIGIVIAADPNHYLHVAPITGEQPEGIGHWNVDDGEVTRILCHAEGVE